MAIILFILISYILLSLSLYKVFEKAGEDAWKGLVPGYNFVIWAKLIGRPAWWAALLLIPIVNIFIYTGMCVDMVRSFGKYDFKDSALAVIYAPLAFFNLGKEKYLGPTLDAEKVFQEKLATAREKGNTYEIKKLESTNPYKKTIGREWTEAIIFAVFAAAFIRMFLIEAFVIPTSSMEGSLLVGDFLFVSKAHYGIRTPKTIAMVPLLHNHLPFFDTESYLEQPSLSMKRLPALQSIKHNDPVVFNYPEGDSVYLYPGRTYSIHDMRRNPTLNSAVKQAGLKLITRPIDKKDHYIKRCIGLPGDSLQIINRQVHINGKAAVNPSKVQYTYIVQSKTGNFNKSRLQDWGVNLSDRTQVPNGYFLNAEQVEKIKSLGDDILLREYSPVPGNDKHLFPHDPINAKGWTYDNYGPIYIPKKGATITINAQNIAFFKRAIVAYEGNTLSQKNGKFYINDKETNSYTFQQDYFWMMGDNRHNSEDSRVWGFVPKDHVVGKPLFIWFSTKNASIRNGINWNRIFSTANKM